MMSAIFWDALHAEWLEDTVPRTATRTGKLQSWRDESMIGW